MDPTSEEGGKILRKAFHEITKGYSLSTYNNKPLYVKHFDYGDQIEIDDYYNQVFNKVREKGLPTTEEAFNYIKKEGMWTATDERNILEAQMFLEGLLSRRKSLIIPSQIEELEKQIAAAQKEVDKYELQKQELLHDTCETYTEKKVNDFSMWVLYYKDPELTERLFTWKEFYEIEKNDLTLLFALFMQATKELNTANIKQIALEPFFVNYFNLLGSDASSSFFPKPVYELSYNQVTLLSYARVFKNIFENVEDIPEEVKNKPDALIDFAESSKKAQKFKGRASEKDGYSVVGATKRDMQRMGIGGQDDTIDISQLAKQKGGSLSIQDFAQ